ncbi:unnamed protein product, partial [marine sediment metagenome]
MFARKLAAGPGDIRAMGAAESDRLVAGGLKRLPESFYFLFAWRPERHSVDPVESNQVDLAGQSRGDPGQRLHVLQPVIDPGQ